MSLDVLPKGASIGTIIGTGLGKALVGWLSGDPAADARKKREAEQATARQKALEEAERAELLRQQDLSRQRILGALKGAEPSTTLGFKTDSAAPLLVREDSQGAFGITAVVPVGPGTPASGGLQLKLGDDAEAASASAGRGFDTSGKLRGGALPPPPPVPTPKLVERREKRNLLEVALKKSGDEEKALTATLEKLKQSPTPDVIAIKEAEKAVTEKAAEIQATQKQLLDLTAEDDAAEATP